MSRMSEAIATGQPSLVIKPYAPSEDSRGRRRWRAAILAAVAAFCFVYGLSFGILGQYLLLAFLVPIALLAALIVWALPASRSAPVRTIEVCFFALLITLVLWPNYLAIALPGLPWITMIRLTGFPMALALLIAVSQSEAFRAKMAEILAPTSLLWKLLAAFIAILILTMLLSTNPSESIQKFIVVQISWTAVFFVSVYLFAIPGRVERWSVLIWVMVVILGLIAMMEVRSRHVPWAGHIPSFLKIEDPAVEAILQGGGRRYTNIYRAQATFDTSLGFGEFLAMSCPFILRFTMGDYRWPVRLAAASTTAFLLFIAFLTNSRSAMMGCLISFMLWLFGWGVLQWRRRGQSILGPAIVLSYPVIGVAVLGATFSIGRLHRAVWGGGETVDSTQARIDQWRQGIPLLLKNPIGHGIGRGAETLNFHSPGGLLTIDSYFLSALLEYGVVGFLVFFGMVVMGMAYATKALYRARGNDREFMFLVPCIISLAVFIVLKTICSEQGNHPLVFMILGIIAATVYRGEQSAEAGAEVRL